MPLEFRFPDVGEGIAEGEIVKWRVKVGEKVKQDQVIAEIETDKAVVQIPSPASGKILKLNHKEGDTIKVGEVLVIIDSKQKIKEERKSTSVVGDLKESSYVLPAPVSKTASQKSSTVQVLPSIRNLAKELGVDLTKVQGTGSGGRITEEDVKKVKGFKTQDSKPTTSNQKPSIQKKYDMWGYIDRVPLKGVRKSIAKNMVESLRNTAPVTHMEMMDVTALAEFREKDKAKYPGVKVTFLPYIIKAVVTALKEHPFVNSSMNEELEEIILKKYYNIGVAVDTQDGLIVPVIKGADQKTIPDIAKEIEQLAEKTRQRKLDLMDMRGGTFTITNIGSLGGIFATPIINYPEAAILATGKIHQRPVIVDGRILVRWVLPASLTFDHRIFDGAEAARFVNGLKKHLAEPDKLK